MIASFIVLEDELRSGISNNNWFRFKKIVNFESVVEFWGQGSLRCSWKPLLRLLMQSKGGNCIRIIPRCIVRYGLWSLGWFYTVLRRWLWKSYMWQYVVFAVQFDIRQSSRLFVYCLLFYLRLFGISPMASKPGLSDTLASIPIQRSPTSSRR